MQFARVRAHPDATHDVASGEARDNLFREQKAPGNVIICRANYGCPANFISRRLLYPSVLNFALSATSRAAHRDINLGRARVTQTQTFSSATVTELKLLTPEVGRGQMEIGD